MTTTAGEKILADRSEAAAHFPAVPDAPSGVIILPDTQGPANAEFMHLTPMAVGAPAQFDAAVWYAGDRPTNLHEHGHEIEERLALLRVAKGLAVDWQEGKRQIRNSHHAQRGWPGTSDSHQAEVTAGQYGPPGSQGYWAASPLEQIAECISRSMLGAPSTERTFDFGVPIKHDEMLAWWKDQWTQLGVEVPAVRGYTFPLDLISGRADRIGGYAGKPIVGTAAISLTEVQRSQLRLISGQGRKYAVDVQRVGLTGVETTLPDTRGGLDEDSAIAVGASGRWRLWVMVRGDFGSQGWYEARVTDLTATI